jgi:uncharacterized RDD family membrane protein YckC
LSKSASLPAEPFDNFDQLGQRDQVDPQPNQATSRTPAWKQEVNQRLAAHRTRRGGPQDAAGNQASENPRTASARAAEAAARVAARYAKAPSYSQLLAGEARAVVRAAGAAAEAARTAQAAAQAVLAGLESGMDSSEIAPSLWETATNDSSESASLPASAPEPSSHAAPPRWQDEPPAPAQVAPQASPWAGAQPRWAEALPVNTSKAARDVWSEMRVHPNSEPAREHRRASEPDDYRQSYRQSQEEGELFSYNSYDPVGSATIEPVQHISANLIEFPKELVATRKARPRLAEGPYYNTSQESPQLNIFEVDPDLLPPPIFLNDTATGTVAPPEWASIELDHHEPVYAHAEHAHANSAHPPREYAYQQQHYAAAVEAMPAVPVQAPAKQIEQRAKPAPAAPVKEQSTAAPAELMVAPMSDRMLAAVVDGALVTLAFLAAAVVVVAATAHPPTGKIALIASACGLALFGLLYQFLFLSYAEEGTPGMRYARIALCTFNDDNPTPEQMRKRIPALLVSVLPAGLGLLWACFDGDRLSWHDRMTRTYQRKY